jgi:hypothetical protein
LSGSRKKCHGFLVAATLHENLEHTAGVVDSLHPLTANDL